MHPLSRVRNQEISAERMIFFDFKLEIKEAMRGKSLALFLQALSQFTSLEGCFNATGL